MAYAGGALVLLAACASGSPTSPAYGAGSGGAGGKGGNAASAGGTGGAGARGGTGGASGTGGTGGAGGKAGRGGASAAGSGGTAAAGSCFAKPLFSADQPWNKRVDTAEKDAQSDTIIAALQTRGWGLGHLQIDYSLDVLCAPAGTMLREFEKNGDFYEGDCDYAPVPVPNGGHLEGETGYACENGGDCHLIVIAEDTNKLYEQWRANITASGYQGGCLAVWELDRDYGADLRGEQCTSADAAGLPIAPLLFDADEVASGAIEHAVRFALPNTHLRDSTYVRPATHATGAASAGEDGVPYGARLRLRKDYPLDDLPSDGARVLARALQNYGMILADGGNVALMGQDDRGTKAKWDGLLAPRALEAIQPSDFELVEAGERFHWDGDCVLNEKL
jgi:hypothetical protein